jgi:hypothetical protein
MTIDAKKVTPEQADYLLKFLKREENIDKEHEFFRTAQSFYIDFKDKLRKLHYLSDLDKYLQFKIIFNNWFYWNYEFQSDLDLILDFFLEMYSDTNRDSFYEKFNSYIYQLILQYEDDFAATQKKHYKYTVKDFLNFHYLSFEDFIESICLADDEEFEDETDEKQYEVAKKELAKELYTLFVMEFDLRKIYNNIIYSLKGNKNNEKGNC